METRRAQAEGVQFGFFEAVQPFRKNEYCFPQFNERASTIQDNTGATGLVNEPQLELMTILRVRIVSQVVLCDQQAIACIRMQLKNNCTHNSQNYSTVTRTIIL